MDIIRCILITPPFFCERFSMLSHSWCPISVRRRCEGSGGETHIVGEGVEDGEQAAEVLGGEEGSQKTTLLGVLVADSTDKSPTEGKTAAQEVVGVRVV
jgi:hypothetical protein